MNVLFLNSAKSWGGNEKWTYLAAETLSEDNRVYLAYRKEAVGSRFAIGKIRLPFLNELDLFTILRLVLFVRKKEIELLVPTKRKDYVVAGWVAKLCGIKNVLRLGIVRQMPGWYNYLVYHKLADGIIVNARPIKEVLLRSRLLSEQKIRVVYNGLDVDSLEAARNAPQKVSKPFPFLIVSVGNITIRKGFENLIHGFADFLSLSGAKDAGLMIIGEGEDLLWLKEKVAALGLESRVVFTGFLENPYPYLAMGDVFVLTSENEGISNALLEAMYLKNAVITSRAGGTEEIIQHGENGFLVKTNERTALANRLLDLYRDEALRLRLAENGRQTVIREFSLTRMKEDLLAFCREIVSN